MGVPLAAVVVDAVGLVILAVFDQQLDRRDIGRRLVDGIPQYRGVNWRLFTAISLVEGEIPAFPAGPAKAMSAMVPSSLTFNPTE